MSAKEVFHLRKQEGKILEAYELATKLYEENPNDIWIARALAWCLVDLCKDSAKNNNKEQLKSYLSVLNKIQFSEYDEILSSQIDFVNKLENEKIIKAKELSKNNKHKEAMNLYLQALSDDKENLQLKESLGWEIYRVVRQELQKQKRNVFLIKQHLLIYLNLKINFSKLHSLILVCALELNRNTADSNGVKHIKMLPFLRLWGIENFSKEDFEPYYSENKKDYFPSRAEKAIRTALEEAMELDDKKFIDIALNVLDEVIQKSKKQLWCLYTRAQVKLYLKKIEEALADAKIILKEKKTEFYAWKFMAEIYKHIDKQKEIACYCKALSFNNQEGFVGKIRLEFAKKLIEMKEFDYAKEEVEKVFQHRVSNQWNIPNELRHLRESEWYLQAKPIKNYNFDKKYKQIADEILCEGMLQIKANLGEEFEKTRKDNNKKQKCYSIYINFENKVIKETALKKLVILGEKLELGMPLMVYAEKENNKLKIYNISSRQGEKWDILERKNKEVVRNIRESPNNHKLMGFTTNNIFLPHEIINKYKLKKDECIDVFIAYKLNKNNGKREAFVVEIQK